jgi:hypothetical protein
MLPGGNDTQYRAALAGPHSVYSRVDITDYLGNVLRSDLPFWAGTVTATLQSRVARTISLQVDRSFMPVTATGAVDPTGLLAPFGNRINAYRGINYGDGQRIYWQCFCGRIETVSLARNGVCSLTGLDLAAEVIDADFESPLASVPTNKVDVEVKRLITGGLPSVVYGAFDGTGQLAPAITWTTDRAGALDSLTAAIGCFWYFLPNGQAVMRRVPWTKPGQVAVAALSDGPGGLLVDYNVAIGRTGVRNAVAMITERSDGSAPLFTVVRDTDPSSPTYYLGAFGRKPVQISNQVPLTAGQQSLAAQVLLARLRALTATWSPVATVPDASLELGDLLTMTADAGAQQQYAAITATQVITGFTLPLLEDASMQLSLAAYTPTSF